MPTASPTRALNATIRAGWERVAPEGERATYAALVAVVAASAALGIALAWRPADYLIAHTVPDDAFYYFQTARNIVHGRGVSVDGEVWANGFHPLWLIVLLPVYAIFRGSDLLPFHVALTFSALLVSLSGLVLYATARRLALSPLAALCATAIYLLHPITVGMSVNGLETGVNVALFVALLYCFVAAWQERTIGWYALASASAGLLVLSRTDYGFVAAVLLPALLVRDPTPRAAAALAAPAVLLTLPWFVWNIAVFGSPLQVSGGALPYVAHQLFVGPDASAGETVAEALRQVRKAGLDQVPAAYVSPTGRWSRAALLLGALLVAAAVAVAWRSRRPSRRSLIVLLAVPSAGLVVQFFIHAGVRWYVRDWYFLPLVPLLALVIGLLLDAARESRLAVPAMAALAALVIASGVAKGRDVYQHGLYPLQLDMLAGARWIDGNTPPRTRVGGFNSGLVTYFDHRTTVNLDGVMNPDAADAMRDHRVAAYMRERRIDALADFEVYPLGFYQRFLGADLELREVASFQDHRTSQGAYAIWTVEPPANR